MKLLLHVGTEKTGSSYLQTSCGQNRQFLQKSGLWFPDAGEYEKQMQQGIVSPGNGLELGGHIGSDSWANVTTWLAERVNEAKRRECERLLLSYELLFAELSADGAVEKLQSAATAAGIAEIGCLLVIREPIDHVISLYKHRAKSGRAGSIEQWIEQGYSLPQQIEDFLAQVDKSSVQLLVRKYEKSSAALVRMFFTDWLGITEPPTRIDSHVNPSLSLSELAVIRHVVASRPDHRRAFYSEFLALSREQKADESDMEVEMAKGVETHLSRFNEVWQLLDARLAADGGIEIPRTRYDSVARARRYSFSEAQIEALHRAHARSATLRYTAATLAHRLGIGKLVRATMSRVRSGLRKLRG